MNKQNDKSLFQLELDGYCNYLGKEHFPKFSYESSTDQNKDHLRDVSLALIPMVFCEHAATSFYVGKILFLVLGKQMYFELCHGKENKWAEFFFVKQGDYELFKCATKTGKEVSVMFLQLQRVLNIEPPFRTCSTRLPRYPFFGFFVTILWSTQSQNIFISVFSLQFVYLMVNNFLEGKDCVLSLKNT